VTWSDEELQFELRPGELDKTQELYVYIFDENSNPNPNGLPVCIDCQLKAPEAIEIRVE
jgi:hypothetical protein